MSDPRTFTDSVGVTWTVHCIISSPMSQKLVRVLGEERRRGGWLLFRSEEGERRRLSPYPKDWVDLSDWMLERWCMKAAVVPPAPERRSVDKNPPS